MIKFVQIINESTVEQFEFWKNKEIQRYYNEYKKEGYEDEEAMSFAKEKSEDVYVEDSRLNEHNEFLRIGKLSGRSKVGLGKEWTDETGQIYESGMSVYFLRNRKNIIYPNRRRAQYGIGGNYFEHMFNEVLNKQIENEEIHIVSGKLIPIIEEIEDRVVKTFDVGSDGEPLLEPSSVKVIRKLTLDEFKTFTIDGNITVEKILNLDSDY
jgi:hypothetical protein